MNPAPLWLFADQLGPHFHLAEQHRDREVLLVESAAAFERRRCHRQKLHLVLSGLRHLKDELGERATLVRARTYRAALRDFGRPVVVHEPGSHRAEDLVRSLQREGAVESVLPTPGFALPRTEFEEWVGGRRRFRMDDFYRHQRRRFDVLLDGGEPVGGRWSYDHENRQRPPRREGELHAPEPWTAAEDDIDQQVRDDLDRWEREGALRPVGRDGSRVFPVTSDEAESAAQRFLDHRLPLFGPYQDAMLDEDWAMAHALLSAPLNLGLLDPLVLVREAERRYRDGRAPLASVEGFVRQVLGWREYVWHLYWNLGREYLDSNFLDAKGELPQWWSEVDGDRVEAECLRQALNGVRDRGWAHHIQRLMVLGNHGLQREYRPAALNEWFSTAFVDGTPWVMPVNVLGMSQHADGGVVATKPYAAGGSYINRMSDYCKRCPFDPRERTGDRACPFTAGYWAWLHRHADDLAGNHRMRQPIATMRRLGDLDQVVAQESGRRQI